MPSERGCHGRGIALREYTRKKRLLLRLRLQFAARPFSSAENRLAKGETTERADISENVSRHARVYVSRLIDYARSPSVASIVNDGFAEGAKHSVFTTDE